MIELELSKRREGMGRIVEYVTLHVPLNSAADFGCSKPGLITFEQAQELADLVKHGQRSGDVDGWAWRVV